MRRLKGFYSNYFGKKYFPSHYNQCPQREFGFFFGGGGVGLEGTLYLKRKGYKSDWRNLRIP